MSPHDVVPDPHASRSATDAVAVQARGWIASLASGGMDAGQLQAFEHWLAQPGHRRVFEHERVLWRSLGPIPRATGLPGQGQRRARFRRIALAAVAVLGLASIAPEAWLRMRADHRSGPAVTTIALADGSRAVLDAGSAIAVHFNGGGREIALLRGRAWFEVAPVAGRPFRVTADGGVVEDISTAFAVSRGADAVETGVEQGRVRVAAKEAGGWTYLQAGQRAGFAAGGSVTRLQDTAPDRIAPWRQGELLLQAATVADAVVQVGRYRHGPTFLRGDFTALPAISAALRIDRPDQALDTLAGTAGLRVTRLPLGVAIVQPAVPVAR